MRSSRLAFLALLVGAATYNSASAQSIDPKYLPGDSEVVVTINLKQMLSSELAKGNQDVVEQGKKLVIDALSDRGVTTYLEKAGVDIFRDLHSITIAGPGTGAGDKGIALLSGKFTPSKIEAAAKSAEKDNPASLKVTKVGTRTVYMVTPEGGNDKVVYVTLLNDGLMLAAISKDTLKASAERIASDKKGELNKSFATLLETTNAKQSFSVVTTGSALARGIENAPIPNADQLQAAAGVLKNVDGLSLAFTLAKNVDFQLGINAKDKKSADEFAKQGNVGLAAIKGIVAGQAKQDERFLPAVDVAKSLRIATEGTNVVVRGQITYEAIATIIKNLPRQ